jgi:hypothetical protein
MNNDEELVRYQPGRTLTPVMNLTLAKSRLAEFQQFVREYMVEGEDYGLIPGTNKKTLYKPGADKLCELYGLSDSYRVIDRLVDFDRGLFDYEIECTLSRDGIPIATGLGSCSSFEGKYRWRDSKRICPQCGKDTIIKGKEEYGGGWLCFKKNGGCGAKFEEHDEQIESQIIGRVENDDIATIKNTILKMAKKRSKVDATLAATRSGGVFTQDFGLDEEKAKAKTPVQPPKRKSETGAPEGNGLQDPNLITKGQISRLWAIGFASNRNRQSLEKPQIEAILKACGFDHADRIPKSEYDRVVAAIEAGLVPEEREPGQD